MAWWKTAKPGDPVVCVRTDTVLGRIPVYVKLPKVGRTYTIRSLDFDETASLAALRVNGLVNGLSWDGRECAYWVGWFRPAKTTDLPESLIKCLDAPVSGKRETVS